jgi:hypothetical protein
VITHVVLFTFADPDDAFEARRRITALRGRIPSIRSLSAGVDAGRSGSDWQLALVSTHDDWEGLETYRKHPAHTEFLEWLEPRVTQRAAVDFES